MARLCCCRFVAKFSLPRLPSLPVLFSRCRANSSQFQHDTVTMTEKKGGRRKRKVDEPEGEDITASEASAPEPAPKRRTRSSAAREENNDHSENITKDIPGETTGDTVPETLIDQPMGSDADVAEDIIEIPADILSTENSFGASELLFKEVGFSNQY